MDEETISEIRDVTFIARTSVFTALTFVITVVFSAYIPSTRGYFNFGEVGVYLSGLLGGPLVGVMAGGIGSMLADLALGYAYFAPGTLVIKGIEGGIVGLIGRKIMQFPQKKKNIWIALAGSLVMSIYLFWLLLWSFRGVILISLNLPTVSLDPITFMIQTYTFSINWRIGLMGALILAVIVMILSIFLAVRKKYLYIPCLIGGPIMVTGYFLYEAFILGFGVMAAAVEIPFNIGQMTVGALVSVPILRYLKKAGINVGE